MRRAHGAGAVEQVVALALVALPGVASLEAVAARDDCSDGACRAPGQCFVAGTPVLTDHGLVAIEEITVGTTVLARDPEGDAIAWRRVTRTYARVTSSLIALTIAGPDGALETLRITDGQRVQVAERGWVAAGALAPGRDWLVDTEGQWQALVAAEELAADEPVFDLEVDRLHSYFVGRLGVWVHSG
jgi:hypothetical protein